MNLQRKGSYTIKFLDPYKGRYWILDIILSKNECPYLVSVLCLSGLLMSFKMRLRFIRPAGWREERDGSVTVWSVSSE